MTELQTVEQKAPDIYTHNAAKDKNARDLIDGALKPYGARITNDGRIQKGNREPSGIYVTSSKGRIRFRYENGSLAMSGPLEAKTVKDFVERYWFWAPVKGRAK